jgi:hypothetical protein
VRPDSPQPPPAWPIRLRHPALALRFGHDLIEFDFQAVEHPAR